MVDDDLDWRGERVETAPRRFGTMLRHTDPQASGLTWDAATKKLASGGCAFESMNDSAFGELIASGAQEGKDFGFTAFPGTEASFLAVIDVFVAATKAKNAKSALAFLGEISRPAAQRAFNEAKGSVPVVRDVEVSSLSGYQRASSKTLWESPVLLSVAHGEAMSPEFQEGFCEALSTYVRTRSADRSPTTSRKRSPDTRFLSADGDRRVCALPGTTIDSASMTADPQRSAEVDPAGSTPAADPAEAPGDEAAVATEQTPADAPPPTAPPTAAGTPDAGDPVPRWLRSGAAIAWRLLVLAAAIALVAYALAYLRIVVLPIIVAVLVSTVLSPPTRWLTRHRFSNGAAAATVLLAGIGLLVLALSMAGAAVARQVSDLAESVQAGIREAGEALSDPPFNLSQADIDRYIDNAGDQLSDSSGALTGGVLHGAVVAGEVITGLIITLLLLFFFLKDGPSLWRWIVDTFGGRQRARLDELARRSYSALTGYVRGLVLVGAADATMIGAGLAILGVPLVVPLMLLTFLGAFVPLIGAFSAGLAAVLIALVDGGVVTALIVLALVVAVQQVEGHVLYPLIMGRTIHIHPIAVIVALATGGILAGIIGVFISVPILTLAATALAYARETRETREAPVPPAPASPPG